jgi:DUF917 family protein
MWTITESDLESIAIGGGILGTGGGGNPYIGQLRAREAIRKHGPVKVLAPDELKETDQIVCVGGIGAPTVGIEKMRDIQSLSALRAIEEYLDFNATALISNEIGGSNSLEPLIPAAITGLPVVDADGMGRAFPEIQMKTFFVYGVPFTPLSLADEKGNTAVFSEAVDAKWVERMARAVTIQMGCVACYATTPMTSDQIKSTAILNSLSLAKSLGESVKRARTEKTNIVQSILETCPGKELFNGKIVDVERKTSSGFALGSVTIDGLNNYQNHQMRIEFQNENLIAEIDGEIICMVPDLICLIDSERGDPITTELLRYGFRVTVLGFPAPKLWKTNKGLEVVGPQAFGYNFKYRQLEL